MARRALGGEVRGAGLRVAHQDVQLHWRTRWGPALVAPRGLQAVKEGHDRLDVVVRHRHGRHRGARASVLHDRQHELAVPVAEHRGERSRLTPPSWPPRASRRGTRCTCSRTWSCRDRARPAGASGRWCAGKGGGRRSRSPSSCGGCSPCAGGCWVGSAGCGGTGACAAGAVPPGCCAVGWAAGF